MKKMSSKKTMSSKPTYKVGGSTKKPLKKAQSGTQVSDPGFIMKTPKGAENSDPGFSKKTPKGAENIDPGFYRQYPSVSKPASKPAPTTKVAPKPAPKPIPLPAPKSFEGMVPFKKGGSVKSVSDMQQRGKESITKGTGKFTTGVQMYGPGYKGNPNSPKPFVGAAPAKKKGGAVKSKKK